MNFNDPNQRRVFFDVHRDLPREGPGDRDSTLEALRLATGGKAEPRWVVDVGCGPGMQTLDLADALPKAHILAVDLHEGFVRELARRARDGGAGDRVHPVRADMGRLPLSEGSADLVWCEGAAYVMGVAAALDAWRSLLRAGGTCAFTEAVWLREGEPPERVRACWAEYPGMAHVASCRQLIRNHGYELVDDFVLPPSAWWDHYYNPMKARLDALDERYRGDATSAAVLAECREEIDVYRRHGDWYGYAFFVARKP